MSEMSVPIKMPQSKRLEVLRRELTKGKNIQEIAGLCGVNERTIYRDLKLWHEQGGFEEWLQVAFFQYINKDDVDNKTRLQNIVRLLEKTMKQRIEADVQGGFNVQIKILDETSELEET